MRSLEEILHDIDETDWSRLHHAYGEAGDVRGLLRGLASQDEDVRAEALYVLFGTIWHQGTIYEASPHAVPFLLEILKSPEVSGKEGIALLVAELADGTASLESFADEDNELSRTFREYLRKEGRDFDEELESGRRYVRETREAVSAGIELLVEYLPHDEASVREAVARALAHYPQRAHEFVPLLEDAREAETEDYVIDTMDATIVELRQYL
jgi:HEAT repeat protein